MKTLFLILFLTSIAFAQKEFGNTSDYDSTSAMSDPSTFMVRHGGVTRTLTWFRLNQLLNAETGENILALDNNWTGTNDFSGGKLILPNYTLSTLTLGEVWFGNDSTLYIRQEDGTGAGVTVTNADREWVQKQNFGSGVTGAYIDLSTNQTAIGGLKSFTSGGFAFTGTADNRVHLYPSGSAPSVFGDGKVFGNYTTGFSRLKLQHYLQGSVEATAEFPEVEEVKAMIDSVIVVQYPSVTDADTLDWSNKDYTHILETPQSGDKTFVFENYGAGVYTLTFDILETQTFSFSHPGTEFFYNEPGKPTNITGSWTYQFIAIDASRVEVFCTKIHDTAE